MVELITHIAQFIVNDISSRLTYTPATGGVSASKETGYDNMAEVPPRWF